MTGAEPKLVEVYWSEAAADHVGPRLDALQSRIHDEVSELIADGAMDWLLHAVEEADETCLLCEGEEGEAEWRVLVQVAEFRPMDGPDGEPVRAEGQDIRFPRPREGENNARYARYWDLIER